jgi:hypothetical protein
MRHPTDGVLRRLIDEPAGVAEADRVHVAGCRPCLTEVAGMQQDAALVDAALVADGVPSLDVDAGWQRLSIAATAGSASAPSRGQTAASRPGRARAMLRRPIVAVVVVGAVLAGAGTAAANGWLQIFATEQVAPLSVSANDLLTMPDLSAYGDAVVSGDPDVHEVADATAAAGATGLTVPQVTELPVGVSGEPTYQVGSRVTATFTFSAERAAAAAAAAGEQLPPLPDGMDGSQLQLVAGPGLAEIWSQNSGLPTLIVARAVAPTAFSSGVPFETIRDYLLSLPGLSPELAAQLRTFTADGSTLPLPVPAGMATTSPDEVNGAPATVLTSNDRSMSAVVWVVDGVVTVVGGALDADEVLTVARGLN